MKKLAIHAAAAVILYVGCRWFLEWMMPHWSGVIEKTNATGASLMNVLCGSFASTAWIAILKHTRVGPWLQRMD